MAYPLLDRIGDPAALRTLERGELPALARELREFVLESVSRVINAITTPEQRQDAVRLRRLLAAHRDARELIEIGAYAPGSNPLVDQAISLQTKIDLFLRQDIAAVTPSAQSWSWLHDLVGG